MDQCFYDSMYVFIRFKHLHFRKQWIKVLKVERDVPRHFRICSKHFKPSDFFPRNMNEPQILCKFIKCIHFFYSTILLGHQMQKKLMLRPSAIPTENLPTEMTNYSHVERSESPDVSSSSYVSLDHSQSDNSNSTGNIVSTANHHQVITVTNNNINHNNTISNINNNNNVNHHNEYQDECQVKVPLPTDNYSYHPTSTPIVQTTTINTSASFEASTYQTLLTPLNNVPYVEISEEPMYMISDGSEIDRNRLASVLNKDDYGDGTVTYVVNFVDY